MSSPNQKKDFDWEKGGVLDDKNSTPLGDVRAKGIPKLKKAVDADPAKRKSKREQFIMKEQSQSYQGVSKKKPESEGSIVIEESQSGLTGEYEDSVAKKLIDTGKKFKGLDRFGKKGK